MSLEINTPILTYKGKIVAACSLNIGDKLMGENSLPRKILALQRMRESSYVVIPVRGEPWSCGENQLVTLVGTNRKKGKIKDITLRALIEENAQTRKRSDRDWKLHKPTRIDFATMEKLPLDPYFLGLWFGDGNKETRIRLGLRSVRIDKPDPEIKMACQEMAIQLGLVLNNYEKDETACPAWVLTDPDATRTVPNKLTSILRNLVGERLLVPDQIKLGDYASRAAFLAGYLDADGSLDNNCIEITQARVDWADAIEFVARSLGIWVTRCVKFVNGDPYQRMLLSGHMDFLPMRIPRKIPAPRRQIKDPLRVGFTLEPAGTQDLIEITLAGDGRFLLGDFTITCASH